MCIGVEGRGGGDVGRGMRGRLWSMRKVPLGARVWLGGEAGLAGSKSDKTWQPRR